jgi:acetoin:2,6-dichlorophenolindophenol oxidoreductase subunit beta
MAVSTATPDTRHPTPDTRTLTYAEALNEALREEMRRDESVFVFGEDVAVWGGGGIFGVTKGLVEEFGPERVRDTPISEEAIVGMAVGAAATGTRPVAEIMYADFMGLAMEPLNNQAAKMRYMFGGKISMPMVVRAQQGGGRGNAAQHSQSLEAWFAHLPGLRVCVPSTPHDAKGLLKTAIRMDDPVVFLEHKVLYFTKGPVPEEEYTIPLGVADVKREGSDATVVGVQVLVNYALEAAEELESDGVSVEVIDPRTVSPLDIDAIVNSVKKTGRLVIAHQAYEQGGIGAEIAARVQEEAFDYLDAPIQRVAGKNVPVPYNETLERAALPGKEDVVEAVRRII